MESPASPTGLDAPRLLQEELALRSADLETAGASEILAWAVERFEGSVSVACSFQDPVLVDLAVKADPGVEVIFLDTGAHFAETLRYVEDLRRRYDLNLRVVEPGPLAQAWPCGTARCCDFRKVEPLERALAGRSAWIAGLKRVDASTRRDTPIASWDSSRNMVKVNPLATWTDDDIASYVAANGLPLHPLSTKGYLSIGCAPTTRPVQPGEDPRAGRWADSDKTECGLHL
ncbi:MAG: phosphoadenylyl-sulfate reductase [Acidimicrobiales bacterium]